MFDSFATVYAAAHVKMCLHMQRYRPSPPGGESSRGKLKACYFIKNHYYAHSICVCAYVGMFAFASIGQNLNKVYHLVTLLKKLRMALYNT
jgi:hypothetical protein